MNIAGLEAAYCWEQEAEGGEAAEERGVPGCQEPEQDQENEETGSSEARYSRQGLKIFFQIKCLTLLFLTRELIWRT